MPHRRKWYVAALLVVAWISGSLFVLNRVEKKINPIGWDLEMSQKIQDFREQTALSPEIKKESLQKYNEVAK